MRRTLVAAVLGLLVATGLQVQPASASSRPGTVTLVSFVKAGYARDTNRTSLSLDWEDARRAKKYEVFVSTKYSMSKAKKYTMKSSKTTITGLARGRDYFFQVRGVNGKKHGKKSSRVGHTTILRPGPSTGLLPLRVMTYNVCSDVCDVKRTTPYGWLAHRQAGVLERIAASGADIVATQEAGNLEVLPPGYTEAINVSAKRLYFKTSRFDLAPATTPEPVRPPNDKNDCRPTYEWGQPTGHIFLGRHAGGCRYAVWAELVDKATGRSFMMVDVHTVSGTSSTVTAYRRSEITTMLTNVKLTNTKRLPVIYAGDFNSHKNSKPSDAVRPVMNGSKLYDGFDLARRLSFQHHNSYNDFKTTPRISYKWGDHIDKVWVDPWTTRVDGWTNFARRDAAGRLVKPIPSDHSPVLVDLRIG